MMKTKLVYVLVSDASDYYYEMLLLSLCSLRRYHPNDIIEVVMDDSTHRRLVEKQDNLMPGVSPVVIPVPPEFSTVQRSRYLKTNLRRFVQGDFLYIDGDTIICESLTDIDNISAEVAMLPETISEWWNTIFQKVGVDTSDNQPFYNSGVIYSKDTPKAHQLYERWFQAWRGYLHCDVVLDQPALFLANLETGSIIQDLPIVWNYSLQRAQIDVSPGAKIFHYFTYSKGSVRKMLMSHIRKNGTNNPIVNRVVENPFTIGQAVFSINDRDSLEYLFSEMLDVFTKTPPLFRFYVSLSRVISRPIRFFSKIRFSIFNQ